MQLILPLLILFCLSGCVRSPSYYAALEQLTSSEAPSSVQVTNAGVTVRQPEGARFPEATRGNVIWSLNKMLPSDTRAELSALRIAPDGRSLAYLLGQAGESSLNVFSFDTQQTKELASGELYDFVYLGQNKFVVTELVRTQPRRILFVAEDVPPRSLAQVGDQEFALLKNESDGNVTVLVQRWDDTVKKLKVDPAGQVQELTSVTRAQNPLNFDGCSYNSHYQCESIRVESTDGVKVPVTLLRHHSRAQVAPQAILVHSYGAYGQVLSPQPEAWEQFLLRRNWMIAYPHIRGGGELGSAWHTVAQGKGKRLSVDDLEAAMRSLCTQYPGVPLYGYASSAGAVFMLRAAVENPGLVARIVLRNPLLDPQSSAREFPEDVAEWGAASDPSLFSLYSPAHFNGQLPPTLVLLAERDDLIPLEQINQFTKARPHEVKTITLAASNHWSEETRAEQLRGWDLTLRWLLDGRL